MDDPMYPHLFRRIGQGGVNTSIRYRPNERQRSRLGLEWRLGSKSPFFGEIAQVSFPLALAVGFTTLVLSGRPRRNRL